MTFEGWEQVAVGEVARPISRREDVVDERQYRLMGVRLYGNGCRLHTETSGSELKTRVLSVVRAGDITYNKMWTSKGAFAVVTEDFDGYHVTSEYPTFRPDAKRVDLQFFGHVLRTPQFVSEARNRCCGSTSRARLNPKNFAEIPVLLPPLAEQKKIAEILGSVDEAIQATQAVIDQTRKVKQGLLQQLLTRGIGHTRFKQTEIGEIPESWEVVFLEAVLEDLTYGLTVRPKYVDDGVPLVSAKETRDGRLDIDSAKRISFDDFSKLRSRSIPRGGEILVTKTGTIGRTAYIHPGVLPIAISQNVALLRPIAERMTGRFLERIFQSPRMKGLMQRSAKVLSVLDLQLGTMRQFCVPVPPLEEQSEICTRVAAVDAALDDAARTLDSQFRLKAGLMSDLLSGRVRAKVNQ